MSHPRPQPIRQPRPLDPLSQTASRSASALHPHRGQQHQDHTPVALSPATSQHLNDGGGPSDNNNPTGDNERGNNEGEQGNEGTDNTEKRGRDLLRDALNQVSHKRQRRQGRKRYVLLDT